MQHPDTVGGAMLSGVREASRAMLLMKGGDADTISTMLAQEPRRQVLH